MAFGFRVVADVIQACWKSLFVFAINSCVLSIFLFALDSLFPPKKKIFFFEKSQIHFLSHWKVSSFESIGFSRHSHKQTHTHCLFITSNSPKHIDLCSNTFSASFILCLSIVCHYLCLYMCVPFLFPPVVFVLFRFSFVFSICLQWFASEFRNFYSFAECITMMVLNKWIIKAKRRNKYERTFGW